MSGRIHDAPPHPTLGPLPAECPDCHGIGHVGAHGPALVRAAPIREVRPSGKGPARVGEWWAWYGGGGAESAHGPDELPPRLAKRLVRRPVSLEGSDLLMYFYPSEGDAWADLSGALIREAKGDPCPT